MCIFVLSLLTYMKMPMEKNKDCSHQFSSEQKKQEFPEISGKEVIKISRDETRNISNSGQGSGELFGKLISTALSFIVKK